MKQPQTEGSEPMELGGKKYYAAPLPFVHMKRLLAAMRQAERPETDTRDAFEKIESYMDEMADLAYQSLVRNHPGITREEIEESLDLVNVRHVMAAINKASGLAPGGAQPGVARG